MHNKYTATVEIADRLGTVWRLEYDYAAEAAVLSAFGSHEALNNLAADVEKRCTAAAIFLRRHHPDVTPEMVRAASFPVMPLVEAMNRTITFAAFGPDGPPAAEKGPPPAATEGPQTA